MEQDFNVVFDCFISIFLCFLLSVVFLASLYVWKSPFSRDHPSTIKKRFISVFAMLFISPCFLYLGLNKDILDKTTLFDTLGLKLEGFWQALFLPLLLTMILFLGPISMELSGRSNKDYSEETNTDLTKLIWIRTYIAAPLSEEFTYRSCMMPLLLQCFSPLTSILINPLFFGVAHFHHMRERIKHMGLNFSLAFQISCFQFCYTTLFGMYSAYIFYRTNHFISIFAVHAFCNYMGFPEIIEVLNYKRTKKIIIIALFVIGFIAWCFLLKPLTEPKWYHNKSIWYEV